MSELSRVGYLMGRELALEKLGYADPQILAFLKSAGEQAAVVMRTIKNIGGKASSKAAPVAKITGGAPPPAVPFPPAAPQVVGSGAVPHAAPPAAAPPAAAPPAAAPPMAPEMAAGLSPREQQYQKVIGELGKQRSKTPKHLRALGGMEPWQRNLLYGGAGVGVLGAGAGLGHAMTSRDH